ncbi:galactose mutarotase [Lachnospiraceae bacterium ZAX-1]
MQFSKSTFGYTKNKKLVSLYHVEHASGAYLEVLDYGCRIHSICVPNKVGMLTDVCLGYPDITGYENDTSFQGAVIGRHANRIGNSSFTLNGVSYQLEKNNGENHLHGGSNGFHAQIWNAVHENNKLIFSRTSLDGEAGYPGNLNITVIYEWTADFHLKITYKAVSDKDTVFNITNHTYFNLNGHDILKKTEATADSGISLQHIDDILNHKLQIFATKMTDADSNVLPNGTISSIIGTPFDFRALKKVGKDIDADNEQLLRAGGYDHNFILDGTGFRKAAVLQSPDSGIQMTCFTDQPGIQVYSGNNLSIFKGKYGEAISRRGAICLETQHFPNATNIPSFPPVVLKANDEFLSRTSYVFDLIG